MVKQRLHKAPVVSSILTVSSKQRPYSSVAERILGMDDVDGSIPSSGTKITGKKDKYYYNDRIHIKFIKVVSRGNCYIARACIDRLVLAMARYALHAQRNL